MRILIHDYSGHAFTVQLARWLGSHGHEVEYWYSADIESPRGALSPRADDVSTFRIRALTQGAALTKYNFLSRFWQESNYGARAAALVAMYRPEIVLSNAPPTVQNAIRKQVQKDRGRFFYWLQDIYSAALTELLKQNLPLGASAIGSLSRRYEFSVLRASDHVFLISEDFLSHCAANGVDRARCSVVRNWASLDEIPVRPKENAWSRAHRLDRKFVFLFAGTLGLKHNPGLLTALARSLSGVPEAVVVVVSQGRGRQWLEQEKRADHIDNLYLLDFQPHEILPEVLATGDVVIAILEPFAGELSVPSKILAYLCSGRPLLAALPPSNLATRILREACAGVVVEPEDEASFLAAARALMEDKERRQELAAAARVYAEKAFDIDKIGNRFLDIFYDRSSMLHKKAEVSSAASAVR